MPDRAAIREIVKSKYGAIAESNECCTPEQPAPCCGAGAVDFAPGYTPEELSALPRGAELGLGCGRPTAHAEIRPGEIVVDLGSGAGVDCFLAAKAVGERGLVIGVDMTDAMLEKARANAQIGGFANVQFRKGEIDRMPIDSGSVDLVISNCVINLVPDKVRVFRDIYRVLGPGGRFCVADVVYKGRMPADLRNDLDQWACCIGGAVEKDEYLALARNAGFERVAVKAEVDYDYRRTDEFSLASVTVIGYKPDSNGGR